MNWSKRKTLVIVLILGLLTIMINIMDISDRLAYKKMAGAVGYENVCVSSEAPTFEPAVMIFTEEEASDTLERLKEANERDRKAAEAKRKAAKTSSTASYATAGNNRFYLAAVICQEVGNMDTTLMMMVANVVMNRVASPHFPNTIYGVLTQRYQYGMMWKYGIRFPSYASERMKAECYAVADRILAGERVLPGNVVFQAEFPQGSGTYAYYPVPHGLDLYFCYG